MGPRDFNNNGRVTPPGRSSGPPAPERGSSLRRRSPWAFWAAVLVLVGMVASIFASLLAALLR